MDNARKLPCGSKKIGESLPLPSPLGGFDGRIALFPDYAGKTAVEIDMDAAVRLARPRPNNPFRNEDLVDRWLRSVHRRADAAYSFGGYLEDRRNQHRGTYLDDSNAVHLGIDLNVPAGTKVCVAHACTVVRVVHDPDQKGGWGGVMIFELQNPVGNITHFLYGHLAVEGKFFKEGDRVDAGTVVATLGTKGENGGWFEHLHVQAMTQAAWDSTQGLLKNFDGYAPMPDGGEHPLFPNPAPLLYR